MFTYGFYNSLDGDRKYNAEQISAIFDGLIGDGVYSNIGEKFAVVPGEGLSVIVKTGRAWFNHTWNLNDAWITLALDTSEPLRSRIDSVVLEVNSNIGIRENSIKIIKGSFATSPTPPTLTHADGVDQYCLANVTIRADATSITASDIAIRVGQGETPYVTALLKTADISEIFNQWDGEFHDWLNNLKQQLTDDVVTNLQKQIDERVKIEDKATAANINSGTADKWVDAKEANAIKTGLTQSIDTVRSDLTGITKGLQIGDIVYSARDLEAETNGEFLACDQREVRTDTYGELTELSTMKNRRIFNPISSTVRSATSTQMSLLKWSVLGGPMHNGHMFGVYINGTTPTLYDIRFDTDAKKFTVASTFRGFTLSNGINNYLWYITDTHIYLLNQDKTTWAKIQRSDGGFVQYTDSASAGGNAFDASASKNATPSVGYIVDSGGCVNLLSLQYNSTDSKQGLYKTRFSQDGSTRTLQILQLSNIGTAARLTVNDGSHECYNCYGDMLYWAKLNSHTSSGSVTIYYANLLSDSAFTSKQFTNSSIGMAFSSLISSPGQLSTIVNENYIIIIASSVSTSVTYRQYYIGVFNRNSLTFITSTMVTGENLFETDDAHTMIISPNRDYAIFNGAGGVYTVTLDAHLDVRKIIDYTDGLFIARATNSITYFNAEFYKKIGLPCTIFLNTSVNVETYAYERSGPLSNAHDIEAGILFLSDNADNSKVVFRTGTAKEATVTNYYTYWLSFDKYIFVLNDERAINNNNQNYILQQNLDDICVLPYIQHGYIKAK